VWVANTIGVTELDESNGLLVRVIKTSPEEINSGIAASGSRVWLVSDGGGRVRAAVTEFNSSNGSVVRVITAKAAELVSPNDIAASGRHVWVTNGGHGEGGGGVSELSASSGALVHSFSSPGGIKLQANAEFNAPYGIAVSDSHVWVADGANVGNSPGVAELNASNGALVQMVNPPKDEFLGPSGIAVAGSDVWVTDTGCNEYSCRGQGDVVELNASTGSLVRYISGFQVGSALGLFGEPSNIAANTSRVWFTSETGLTELNASTGSVLHNFSAGAPV
jgi:hypothetical protein